MNHISLQIKTSLATRFLGCSQTGIPVNCKITTLPMSVIVLVSMPLANIRLFHILYTYLKQLPHSSHKEGRFAAGSSRKTIKTTGK